MSVYSERGSRVASSLIDSLIIPHPNSSEPRVLLSERAGRWSLPSLTCDERHFWQTTQSVNRRLLEKYGIDAVALRCVAIDECSGIERFVYEIDTLRIRETPVGGEWVSLEELPSLVVDPPEDRQRIEHFLSELAGTPVHPLRPAWSRPGWFAGAREWMDCVLRDHGIETMSPPIQVRAWGRSTVLCATTSAGDFYLKAVPPMFTYELSVTNLLSRRFPDAGARVLATDSARGWFLTAELPGKPLETIDRRATWESAFRSLAEMQMITATMLDEFVEAGCPTRSIRGLRGALTTIVHDDALRLAGEPAGLSNDDIEMLRSALPRLIDACDELDMFGVPLTIEHGDLHPGNVVVDDDEIRFFDWSDCAISHPFFSLVLYAEDTFGVLPDTVETRLELRDAYLDPWTNLLPGVDLPRAFDLAQVLAPLAYAWMYQSLVLPGLEQQWEMNRMGPGYLRATVKRLHLL
jgi:hypothetical protein